MSLTTDYSFDGAHWRPIASVMLTSIDRISISTTALVDSGADLCMFPTQLATALGLKLSGMRTEKVIGIGGSPITAYFDLVTIDLGHDVVVQCEVGFASGMGLVKTGLLGQRGFFSAFKVCFDLPGRTFTIS